jgi:hydrogenase/urease accessory protein HupE
VVGDREITAVAVFNGRDLEALTDGSEVETEIAPDILHVREGGKSVRALLSRIDKEQNDNIAFHLSFDRTGVGAITISSGIIERLPFGHRQYLAATDASGARLGDCLFSARDNQFTVAVPAKASLASHARLPNFFALGVRHILTGYDHLLFLFGLLVVCRSMRGAVGLISSFTLAHSLTLALATFGLVNLQSRLVEPAIAASIVYVGVENLYRRDVVVTGRWILTFLFGLIHGLGFAAVLRELGVASNPTGAALPFIGFNLGVEAGQLSIAAIVLPLIWQLRQRPSFIKLAVPAFSLTIAFAGGFWLLERIIVN